MNVQVASKDLDQSCDYLNSSIDEHLLSIQPLIDPRSLTNHLDPMNLKDLDPSEEEINRMQMKKIEGFKKQQQFDRYSFKADKNGPNLFNLSFEEEPQPELYHEPAFYQEPRFQAERNWRKEIKISDCKRPSKDQISNSQNMPNNEHNYETNIYLGDKRVRYYSGARISMDCPSQLQVNSLTTELPESIKLPEAIVTIEKANCEKCVTMALFDTGSDVIAIKTEFAQQIGMRIYQLNQNFMTFNKFKSPSRGITQALFKLTNPLKEDCKRIYVFDELSYDLILGANFAYWSNATAMMLNNSEWVIVHYNQGKFTPFRLSIEVPDKISYDIIYHRHFLKIFGPEVNEHQDEDPQPSTSAITTCEHKPKKIKTRSNLKEPSKSTGSIGSSESIEIFNQSESQLQEISTSSPCPKFKPNIPPEIDESLLSIQPVQYRSDSKPSAAPKQSSDYAYRRKRKCQSKKTEKNRKNTEKRDKNYESTKAKFFERQMTNIKPPQRFIWLINKNNVRLEEDGLNACALDIKYLSLRVKTSESETKIVQVPCWVSIVDSCGETVFNEFIHYPSTAIEDFQSDHHSLTYNEIKNARHLTHACHRVIQILTKYKRIIVSGQIQVFKELLFDPISHKCLLDRIICVSSYYNPIMNRPAFGIQYCTFILFGRFDRNPDHSSLVNANNAMYLYLIDYERIEKVHSEIIKTNPVKLYESYYGYIYPKNNLMAGLIKDIIDYIGDWPHSLKQDNEMYIYHGREEKREQKNPTYDLINFVHPEPEPRPIPYRFTNTEFSYWNRPTT